MNMQNSHLNNVPRLLVADIEFTRPEPDTSWLKMPKLGFNQPIFG